MKKRSRDRGRTRTPSRNFGRTTCGRGHAPPQTREPAQLFRPGSSRCTPPGKGGTTGWAPSPASSALHVAAPRPAFPQQQQQQRPSQAAGSRDAPSARGGHAPPARPRPHAPAPRAHAERAPRRLTWRSRRRLDGRRQGGARARGPARAGATPAPGARAAPSGHVGGAAQWERSPRCSRARARPGGPAQTERGVAMGRSGV